MYASKTTKEKNDPPIPLRRGIETLHLKDQAYLDGHARRCRVPIIVDVGMPRVGLVVTDSALRAPIRVGAFNKKRSCRPTTTATNAVSLIHAAMSALKAN